MVCVVKSRLLCPGKRRNACMVYGVVYLKSRLLCPGKRRNVRGTIDTIEENNTRCVRQAVILYGHTFFSFKNTYGS
jgi:hypothetical protein